tara:strand:+ start:1273 stop:1695 length:423 start_codon:yes stop_codon:yes gene_type:complete
MRLTSRRDLGFFVKGCPFDLVTPTRSLTVKSYPQADEWKDDDRVLCKKCANRESRGQHWNFTAEDFEKFRRLNDKAGQWMFTAVLVKNGWAKVSFSQDFCTKLDLPCIADGVLHHCDQFSDGSSANASDSVESPAWWELT